MRLHILQTLYHSGHHFRGHFSIYFEEFSAFTSYEYHSYYRYE